MRRPGLLLLAMVAGIGLAGCREEQRQPPGPVTMNSEALGHYCQMNLAEHPGPKAQVHLDGMPAPLFFSQVRDAIAYQRMPEQSHAIRAIYVSDMGRAKSWSSPGADNWVAAEAAIYVVDSKLNGGMGAPEFVPFSDKTAAMDFIARNGGTIRELRQIPDDQVLRPLELKTDSDGNYIAPANTNGNE